MNVAAIVSAMLIIALGITLLGVIVISLLAIVGRLLFAHLGHEPAEAPR